MIARIRVYNVHASVRGYNVCVSFFIHARLETTTLIRTSKSLKFGLLFMQGFRPFSGIGRKICGDEKRPDDLDDDDVQLVTPDMDSDVRQSLIRRLDNLKVVTSGWMHSLQKNDKSPFECLNDLDHFTFHVVEVVSKLESRGLDAQSARSIVEAAEQDFARLRLEVSPFISGGPMDTDAQGNDTQGSNATQDARGSAVDTQGSSTEQMPGADGVEELFADLLNDVEGNDAKGQGQGNSEPTFDDVFSRSAQR